MAKPSYVADLRVRIKADIHMIQVAFVTDYGAIAFHFNGNIEDLQGMCNSVPRFLPVIDMETHTQVHLNLEKVLSYNVMTVANDDGPETEESNEKTEKTIPDNVRKIFSIRQENPDGPEEGTPPEETE